MKIYSNTRPIFATTAAVFITCISACTTSLPANRLTATPTNDPVVGHLYYLPRAEYRITVARELTSCSALYEDDARVIAWLTAQLPSVQRSKGDLALAKAILNDPVFSKGENVKIITDAVTPGRDWQAMLGAPRPGAVALDNNVVAANATLLISDLTNKAPEFVVKLDVEMTAQADEQLVPDGDNFYAINYRDMQKGLKGTDFSATNYPNGTLKSVNVVLDDQTAAVIKSAVGGIAKLAAASAGFPLSLATKQGAPTPDSIESFAAWKPVAPEPCLPAVQNNLAKRVALKVMVDANDQRIADLQAELNKLQAKQSEYVATQAKLKSTANDKASAEGDKAVPKKVAAETLQKKDPAPSVAAANSAAGSADSEVAKADANVKDGAAAIKEAQAKLDTATESAAEAVKQYAAVRKAL